MGEREFHDLRPPGDGHVLGKDQHGLRARTADGVERAVEFLYQSERNVRDLDSQGLRGRLGRAPLRGFTGMPEPRKHGQGPQPRHRLLEQLHAFLGDIQRHERAAGEVSGLAQAFRDAELYRVTTDDKEDGHVLRDHCGA